MAKRYGKQNSSTICASMKVNFCKQHFKISSHLAEIIGSWRKVFDEARASFGGWPSLEKPGDMRVMSVERLYGIMVAKFRVDSLFKATVQPDDKNSEKHILLVIWETPVFPD